MHAGVLAHNSGIPFGVVMHMTAPERAALADEIERLKRHDDGR